MDPITKNSLDLKRLKELFKIRLQATESANYKAFNDNADDKGRKTYAIGRYQYLPTLHGKSIIEMAKEFYGPDYKNKISKGALANNKTTKKEDWQWFLNDPTFQEHVFDKKFDSFIIDDVIKIANTENLKIQFDSLDEIAQIVHYRGGAGAKDYYINGNTKVESNNMAFDSYKNKGKNAIIASGKTPYSVSQTIPYQNKLKLAKEYKKQVEEINKNEDYDFDYKKALIEDLQNKYTKNEKESINEVIQNRYSLEGFETSKERIDAYVAIKEFMRDNNMSYDDIQKKTVWDTKVPQEIKDQWKNAWGRDMLAKNSKGVYESYLRAVEKGGNVEWNDGKKVYLPSVNELAEDLYGLDENGKRYDIVKSFSFEPYNEKSNTKNLQKEYRDAKLANGNSEVSTYLQHLIVPEGQQESYVLENKKEIFKKEQDKTKNWLNNHYDQNRTLSLIENPQEEVVTPPDDKENDYKGNGNGNGNGNSNGNSNNQNVQVSNDKKSDEDLKNESLLNDVNKWQNFYGNMETGEPGAAYDKNNFKKEIPFEALTGLAVALNGKSKVDTKVPLHDEQIGIGFLNYIADLKKISDTGLPPEVEAASKQKLNEAYKLAQDNIVKASAGNRNLVLGNQAPLEAAKMQGLIELQLADYEAKDKAFSAYGEAMKYVSEFENNKEHQNTVLQQQMALQKRQEGQEEMNAGLAYITQVFKDYKDNAPGSFKHQLQSSYLQEIYRFDPNMKDNGNGDTPGTKSYHEKQRQNLKQRRDNANSISKTLSLLTDEEKIKMSPAINQVLNYYVDDLGKANTVLETLIPSIKDRTISQGDVSKFIQTGYKGYLTKDDYSVDEQGVLKLNGAEAQKRFFDDEMFFGKNDTNNTFQETQNLVNLLSEEDTKYSKSSGNASYSDEIDKDKKLKITELFTSGKYNNQTMVPQSNPEGESKVLQWVSAEKVKNPNFDSELFLSEYYKQNPKTN
jgi:hypothetical protein